MPGAKGTSDGYVQGYYFKMLYLFILSMFFYKIQQVPPRRWDLLF